jgi:DNA-binding IscR family transcriptional regulator
VPEAITLRPGAISAARRLGSTAWTVLTALSLDAEPTDDGAVVRASVRWLGRELGLNKDTVARALARLRDAQLLVAQARGFERGTYRLTVPNDVISITADVRAPSRPLRLQPAAVVLGAQLALLETN